MAILNFSSLDSISISPTHWGRPPRNGRVEVLYSNEANLMISVAPLLIYAAEGRGGEHGDAYSKFKIVGPHMSIWPHPKSRGSSIVGTT
jgi:hypothetical protein